MSGTSNYLVRQAWLDGIRGCASVIVAWLHFTSRYLEAPFRSFWALPAEDNRRIYQLQPFRIIFQGQAMIAVFFVVSGYSIATSLITARNERTTLDFYHKLTSSVFRRFLRLYYPVFIMAVISHLLFYIGTFNVIFDSNGGCQGAKPRGPPIYHIKCLVISLLNLVNPGFLPGYTLNLHFWTIPTEFEGSTYLYLTVLALATQSRFAKYSIIGILSTQSLWAGQPHYTAFLSGFLFAELDALSLLRANTFGAVRNKYQQMPNRKRSWFIYISSIGTICTFIIGVFLVCLPVPSPVKVDSDTLFPTDWILCQGLPWWDADTRMRVWYTIGAIMLIGSTRSLPRVRAVFECRLAQSLGRISFSLYLCHITVFNIFQEHFLDWTSRVLSGMKYQEACHDGRNGVIYASWVIAACTCGSLVVIVSSYMTKYVDERSIALSHKIERILSKL